MVNFSKIAKAKSASAAASIHGLFETLDRKATHQILRPVQSEALQALDAQVDQRDVVLKASTGSGKTLLGLVYAEYMRRRYPGQPVFFLCPTTQLINQVLATSAQIGVSAETFPKEGKPLQALEGRSILVCTYDRLFNARSVLVKDNAIPSAIVLDDVHSGVDRIRQKFTVTLPGAAYDQVRAIFQPIAEACDPAVWRGIANNEAEARFEVPYWIWLPQCEAVAQIVEQYADDSEDLPFAWGNVARYLEFARLCISGAGAELSLAVPATEENRCYQGAKHRLFMSASIKDGSSLIRDLGCASDALDRVIEPPSDKGAGERMILPVSLIDPSVDRVQIAALCEDLKNDANVVILTSSAKQAVTWVAASGQLRSGKAVDAAVDELRAASSGLYFVFAQRFDGVDLPDDACRVLVLDGLPMGERLCDQIDFERQKNSPGYNTRAVNRVEQALGRAVRSSADFATVLLVGQDLAAFIGRRDVKDMLEPYTREQIELGRDVADQIRASGSASVAAIEAAIRALLDRDESWKDAHRERMQTVQRSTRSRKGLTVNEAAAKAERLAWEQAKANNFQGAVVTLQEVIDNKDLHEVQRAELLARAAGYMNRYDTGRATTAYRSAFSKNSLLPRPPQLPDRRYTKARQQAVAMCEVLGQYVSPNAAIARIEEIKASLAFAGNADTVERALRELGELLGADASRPEKETGRGPDVLWRFDDACLCIEAKSEKTGTISKGDAEQLLLSTQWCEAEGVSPRDQIVSVFATNAKDVDRVEDVSFGPRLLTESHLVSMASSLTALVTGLSFDGPLFQDIAQMNKKITEANLGGRQIASALGKFNLKK